MFDKCDPNKVKKIKLMQFCGLPLDDTFVIPVKDFWTSTLVSDVIHQATIRGLNIVIRTAWVPDLISSPWAIVPAVDDMNNFIAMQLRMVKSGHLLTHFILHLLEPDGNQNKNSIVGRMLYANNAGLPIDRVLEVAHGERIAKIFDSYRHNHSDKKIATYAVDAGMIQWYAISRSPDIPSEAVNMILRLFKQYEERIELLHSILSNLYSKPANDIILCVEFVSTLFSSCHFYIHDFDTDLMWNS